MTTYEYDGDRLVRAVTVREPEFTPGGVALLVASRRWEAELGPHGFPLSEAMDPANQFAFEGYEKPRMDWADKAMQDAKDRFYEANPKANRNGHRWGVRWRDASR